MTLKKEGIYILDFTNCDSQTTAVTVSTYNEKFSLLVRIDIHFKNAKHQSHTNVINNVYQESTHFLTNTDRFHLHIIPDTNTIECLEI